MALERDALQALLGSGARSLGRETLLVPQNKDGAICFAVNAPENRKGFGGWEEEDGEKKKAEERERNK